MHRLGMRHDYGLDYGPPGDERLLVYTLSWRDWDYDLATAPRKHVQTRPFRVRL
jgi:hypothetical protein